MTTEEMIKVMKAYTEGKTIEWRYSDGSSYDIWHVAKVPVWNWAEYEYRVKPEKKVPVYRRWKSGF